MVLVLLSIGNTPALRVIPPLYESLLFEKEEYSHSTSHVEPAVNRQPGFRRGAVEQSALNNTHNLNKLARPPDPPSLLERTRGPTDRRAQIDGWTDGRANRRTDGHGRQG